MCIHNIIKYNIFIYIYNIIIDKVNTVHDNFIVALTYNYLHLV